MIAILLPDVMPLLMETIHADVRNVQNRIEESYMTPRDDDRQLEDAIVLLQDPSGDIPSITSRSAALKRLLVIGDRAHERLVSLLETGQASNPAAVVAALPLFGLASGIPALERVAATGAESVAQAAALALGTHPLSAALDALRRLLASKRAETVIAGLHGLAQRSDPRAMPWVVSVFSHTDARLRYYALRAAKELGPLQQEVLQRLLRRETDPEVRALAQELLADLDRGAP